MGLALPSEPVSWEEDGVCSESLLYTLQQWFLECGVHGKGQTLRCTPDLLNLKLWGWGSECAFLTNSQVMLLVRDHPLGTTGLEALCFPFPLSKGECWY